MNSYPDPHPSTKPLVPSYVTKGLPTQPFYHLCIFLPASVYQNQSLTAYTESSQKYLMYRLPEPPLRRKHQPQNQLLRRKSGIWMSFSCTFPLGTRVEPEVEEELRIGDTDGIFGNAEGPADVSRWEDEDTEE